MNRRLVHTNQRLLWACIPFLALLFSMPAAAATIAAPSPKPGSYCPGKDIRLIVAEALSASLDLTMRSRAAQINKDQATAVSELISVNTTLHLAASRGAAARTIMLIDAIIQSRSGEDYAQMLTWFPVLHTSLLTMPANATVSAANGLISRAEDIMQGDKDGDPTLPLKKARHMLACDGLDIPLQAAMKAQGNLLRQLRQRNTGKHNAYGTLLDSLRNALVYTLGNSEK